MILIEKQLKYRLYHQVKFINVNNSEDKYGEDILPSNQH